MKSGFGISYCIGPKRSESIGQLVVSVVHYKKLTFSDETIQEIVGIFETNSIEIRLQQSEINGLYEIGSMMEHSCCPNVRMSFDDKFNVSSSN